MRRYLLLFLALLLVAGCCGFEKKVKQEIHTKRVTMEAFVKQMAEEKTTRDLERQMLLADYESWLALDYAVNDDEEAKALLDAIRNP